MALGTMKILFVWLFGVLVVFLWTQAWGEELARLRPPGSGELFGCAWWCHDKTVGCRRDWLPYVVPCLLSVVFWGWFWWAVSWWC